MSVRSTGSVGLLLLLSGCSSESTEQAVIAGSSSASGGASLGAYGATGGSTGAETLTEGSPAQGDSNATGGAVFSGGSGGSLTGGSGGQGEVTDPGGSGGRSGAPRDIQVLTYNIKTGSLSSLETIAEVILSVRPDVVGLQEVDVEAARSGNVHQPEVLAELTGMQWFFAPALHHFQGGQYGNAVLVADDFHVLEAVAHDLDPASGAGEDRSAMEVQVAFTSDALRPDFVFLNSHWEYSDMTSRDAQARHLNRLGAEAQMSDVPAVFVGDLNARNGSGSIDILREFWTVPREDYFGIDWIVHHGEQLSVSSVRNLDASDHAQAITASDHLPVAATYTLRPIPGDDHDRDISQ